MSRVPQENARQGLTIRKCATLGIVSLAGLLAPATVRAENSSQCSLQRVAELPVKSEGGRLLIKVQIEGHDAWVQVDTGSPFSMITAQLADALKLRESPIESGRAYDAAGKDLRHYVRIKKIMLNGMTAEDQIFIVMGEDAPSEARPYDGIFGANFLASYDVEFDIPHGKMNLFLQNRCQQPPVYWTQDFVAVPFALDASLHIVMNVTLDGKPIRAMVDTGAGPSVLGALTAKRAFDFDPVAAGQAPDGEERAGSGATLAFNRHHFDVLDIGGVAFHNTELFVIPDKTGRIIREHRSYDITSQAERNEETPLVIGMHHLARIRAYIAYGRGMIYISSADAK